MSISVELKQIVSTYLIENPNNNKRFFHFPKQSWYPAYHAECQLKGITFDSESKRWWLIEHDLIAPPVCKICGGPLRWFPNFVEYKTFCSRQCLSRCIETQATRMATQRKFWTEGDVAVKRARQAASVEAGVIAKYGSREKFSELQSANFNKHLPKFMTKIGFDPSAMTDEEMLHEWGMYFGTKVQHMTPEGQAAVLDKRFATNMEKYGAKGTLGNAVIQEKYRNTNFARRGVDYVLQDPKIFAKAEKARHKRKDYVMPSGKLARLQGYEPWALDALLLAGIAEEDFVIGGGQISIRYSDDAGQRRTFYPDIYIRSQHRIIEVKSTYTYDRHFTRNVAKHIAAEAAGYLTEFWVYDEHRNLQVVSHPGDAHLMLAKPLADRTTIACPFITFPVSVAIGLS